MDNSGSHVTPRVADLIVRSSGNREFLEDDAFWASCSDMLSLRSAKLQKDLYSAASFVYVAAPFVPTKCLPFWVLATLEVAMHQSTFHALGLKFMQRALAEKVHTFESGALLPSFIINYWANFPDTRTTAGVNLLCMIDQLLASFLSFDSPPHTSIALERLFVELGIENVIRRCVAVKHFDRAKGTRPCLLARLVELNALDYAGVLLGLIESGDGDLRDRILKLENFDNAVLGALRSQECATVHRVAVARASTSYLRQFIDLVENKSSPGMNLHSATLFLSELVRFDSWNGTDVDDRADALQEVLVQHLRPSDSSDTFDAWNESHQLEVLHLATLLCLDQSKGQRRKRQTLASVVMFRLLERKCLSSQHIEWATKLFDSSLEMHGELDWGFFVDATMNSCLSIGLNFNESASGFKEASSYVKFCLSLLKASASSLQRTSQSLAASTLTTMTMHPNFHSAIAFPRDENAVTFKALVLDLMLHCTAIARSCDLDTNIVDTLLEGFEASTTLCDALIRRLLLECCQRQTEVRVTRGSDRCFGTPNQYFSRLPRSHMGLRLKRFDGGACNEQTRTGAGVGFQRQ